MRYFSLIIVLFLITSLSAQSWEPVGAGVTAVPSYDVATNRAYDPVMALYTFHDKLYIGGKFVYSGTRKVNNLACWNGRKIDTVGKGLDSVVSTFVDYKDQLCIGGKFNKLTSNGRTSNFIIWNDSTGNWNTLEGGLAWCKGCDNYLRVRNLCEFDGELYAGGGILGWDENGTYCIEKWNGGKWTRLGNKIKNNLSSETINGIHALIAYRGKLYVGSTSMNGNSIYSWDGNKFEIVGKGLNKGDRFQEDGFSHFSIIKSLAVYEGNLYAGGYFDTAGGKRIINIAKWNDTAWSAVGTGINGDVCSMAVYDGKLYVGGVFDSAGGKPAQNIAVWNGKEWSAMGQGLKTKERKKFFNGRVTSLAVYKNELYAGGTFDFSGTTPLNNLAKLKLDEHAANPKPKKKK